MHLMSKKKWSQLINEMAKTETWQPERWRNNLYSTEWPVINPRSSKTILHFCLFSDLRLLVFFHTWAPGCAPLDSLACQYHQGALSMRVSRKGQVVSALEADWLELTAAYYRRGWSLVDSFVYWDTPKGWFKLHAVFWNSLGRHTVALMSGSDSNDILWKYKYVLFIISRSSGSISDFLSNAD